MNDENRPLVSICIPTYNRVDALKQCLNSIVTNSAYSNEVEIIVSDNASSDGTRTFMEEFIKQHQCVYHRNPKNIGGEANFLQVLSLGKGHFLKLFNDYSAFSEAGLEVLLSLVRSNLTSHAMLVFNNSHRYKKLVVVPCKNIDQVVKQTYWKMSWIGAYGYWADDFNAMENKLQAADTMFLQIDWFLRLFEKSQKAYVCKYDLVDRVVFNAKQGGYNFIKVHTTNFLGMYERCLKDGSLSLKTYNTMKRKVYFSLLKWYYKLAVKKNEEYSYDTDNSLNLFYYHFHSFCWYYLGMLWLYCKTIGYKAKKLFGFYNSKK